MQNVRNTYHWHCGNELKNISLEEWEVTPNNGTGNQKMEICKRRQQQICKTASITFQLMFHF